MFWQGSIAAAENPSCSGMRRWFLAVEHHYQGDRVKEPDYAADLEVVHLLTRRMATSTPMAMAIPTAGPTADPIRPMSR
jgi:hypothetical protein